MQERTLLHQGHSIQVYTCGSGAIPLVLLHGAGLDSAMLSWKEVMETLPASYTAYAVDMLGYGKSDKPEGMAGEAFYSKHLACLEDVVSQLRLTRFCLAGLSLGGAFAIGYALRHPEQIAALIPVDSWGLVSRMPHHRFYYWLVRSPMMKDSFRWVANSRWMARWSIRSSLFGDAGRITDSLVDEIVELAAKPHAEQAMLDYQASSISKTGVTPDYTARFLDLAMPVLFINGEKDSLVPQTAVRVASKTVPHGQLYLMKGCKHWAQKERPEEFVRVVDEFIQKNW